MTRSTGALRVGIVGANPERGWASAAHLPALAAMEAFEVAAVATTRQESADATARKFGIPAAYADWREMLAGADVDIVSVTVKVEHHREIVLAALAAGKHVFCEWPLGLDVAQALEMEEAAARAGVITAVGLQGRASPYMATIRKLVDDGEIGDLISATLVASLNNWGPRLPAAEAYRTRVESGATGLTVPGGHSLDTLCHAIGGFSEVSALVTTQHPKVEIVGTGEVVDATTPDQVLVSGRLANGAVVSAHIKADMASPTGIRLEVNGTEGDIVAYTRPPVGPMPTGIQRVPLVITIARGRKKQFVEVEVPAGFSLVPDTVPDGPPFYTAQLYARLADAIRNGAPMSPDFSDAVRCHRLLEAIQRASDTGERQTL